MARIGLATSPLPRECSTTEPHGQANQTGAGEGNRTLVVSLEGFCSTIELHPHAFPHNTQQPRAPHPSLKTCFKTNLWWRGTDSNHRTHKRADLQSAAFNHSATPPKEREIMQIKARLVKKICGRAPSLPLPPNHPRRYSADCACACKPSPKASSAAIAPSFCAPAAET